MRTEIDEQIVYDQLNGDERAVWSLLLASCYLKVKGFQAYMSDFGEWKEEYELSDTVREALRQIEEKEYEAALVARGIPGERIRKYGFAFCGKKSSSATKVHSWRKPRYSVKNKDFFNRRLHCPGNINGQLQRRIILGFFQPHDSFPAYAYLFC